MISIVCKLQNILSPSSDLGIGVVWDNHLPYPILSSHPIPHFGPSVRIFFKLN